MKDGGIRLVLSRATAIIALVLLTLAVEPAVAAPVLLSYEATPTTDFDLPGLKTASYADREAFSADVLQDIVPKVAAAVGVEPLTLATEITPGGYLLRTNASMQSQGDFADAAADRLAAALGYVFRQESVLVSRLDDGSGMTGYVRVRFPEKTLDATVAQSFFEKAASVAEGLGGGYTAIRDDMIFLNVLDEAGKPYSGLSQSEFLDGLIEAASAFGPPKPMIAASGVASAHFVENDWQASPEGGGYQALLGGPKSRTIEALDLVEDEFARLVERAADRYRWR